MNTKTLWLMAVVATCLITRSALAATDGSIGHTSTGTADITLTVDEVALIYGMEDFTLHYTGGISDVTGFKNVCVYTNDAGGGSVGNASDSTGLYKVTASGDGTGSAFTVANDFVSDVIPYAVQWNDATGGAGTALLATTQFASPFANARITWASGGANGGCGADNASYTVTFTAEDILDHPAGNYTGTLTIVVAPDDT